MLREGRGAAATKWVIQARPRAGGVEQRYVPGVIVGAGDHWSELGDALRLAGPVLLGAALLSAVIFGIVVRPPERLRVMLTDSRRQLVLVGAGIPLGAVSGFLVLYWAL